MAAVIHREAQSPEQKIILPTVGFEDPLYFKMLHTLFMLCITLFLNPNARTSSCVTQAQKTYLTSFYQLDAT